MGDHTRGDIRGESRGEWGLRRQTPWVIPTKTGESRVVDMSAVKARFDLSDREIDVVKCLCRGDTNKEIAAHLFISDLTVKGHLKHIYEKIGVHTRSSVVSTILAGFPTPTDQPTTSTS